MSTDIKNKKIILIILIFVIVIGVTTFYLFRSGILGGADVSQEDEVTENPEFTLDVGILKTTFFENLKRYGNFPIKERDPGRENPFESYE
jgi:hypothetical protein